MKFLRFESIVLTYLLTDLFAHYNLLQVLASANLRRHTSRDLLGALNVPVNTKQKSVQKLRARNRNA